jgi:hypothetical protein
MTTGRRPLRIGYPNGDDTWTITCPDCGQTYTVNAEQVMDRSWMRCPVCKRRAEATPGLETSVRTSFDVVDLP